MSSTKTTKKQLSDIEEALDDAPIDPKDANETVKRLGIDVKSMAANLRAKVANADIADARTAYAKEIERLERRKMEPRPRAEQLVVLQSLLKRAPQAVAMHFHKYESASDEELAELVRSLRHLLGEPDEE
jgi:hypothetical protein